MNDNVKKVFDLLGVEPNEKFKVEGLLGGNHIFTIDENLIISDDSKTIHIYLLTSLLTGDCKIIKLPKKKKKLMDLTKEEYKKWLNKNCGRSVNCDKCIFNNVMCPMDNHCWVNHKYLYSDAFLNKEIEVEE